MRAYPPLRDWWRRRRARVHATNDLLAALDGPSRLDQEDLIREAPAERVGEFSSRELIGIQPSDGFRWVGEVRPGVPSRCA